MSTFTYTPAVGPWVGKVTNLINGVGYNSIYDNIKKFEGQMEALLQPGVWTGYAALQNYQNFDSALKAMIEFANLFGGTFVDVMKEITQKVAYLEISNLGADTNINGVLQDQSYVNMPNLAFINATTEYVTYNVEQIEAIDAQLNSIFQNMEQVKAEIINALNELNRGDGELWDGQSAEDAKTSLTIALNNGYTKVSDALMVCINNIKNAAQAARSMNNQMGYAFNGSVNTQGAMYSQGVGVTTGVGLDGTTVAAGAVGLGLGVSVTGAVPAAGGSVLGASVPGSSGVSANGPEVLGNVEKTYDSRFYKYDDVGNMVLTEEGKQLKAEASAAMNPNTRPLTAQEQNSQHLQENEKVAASASAQTLHNNMYAKAIQNENNRAASASAQSLHNNMYAKAIENNNSRAEAKREMEAAMVDLAAENEMAEAEQSRIASGSNLQELQETATTKIASDSYLQGLQETATTKMAPDSYLQGLQEIARTGSN